MNSISIATDAVHRERQLAILSSLGLFALPMATGILLSSCFPPLDWEGLAWVALVPFAFALSFEHRSIALYVGTYAGGLVFQLAHLDWIRTGYGDTGFAGPRATQWLWQGILLALVWPMAMFFGRWFMQRSRAPLTIAFPLVWIAFEFGRKHLWALVDATGYPFGQLGLTQTHQPRLIQIADLGGVYAVSALVAMVNGFLADVGRWFIARRARLPARVPVLSALIAAIALAGTWFYGEWRLSQFTPHDGPLVCLMPEQTLSAFDNRALDDAGLATAMGSSAFMAEEDRAKRPDLLLWSEAAYPHNIDKAGYPVEIVAARLDAAGGSADDAVRLTAHDPSTSGIVRMPTDEAASESFSVERSFSPRQCMEQYARYVDASLVIGYDRAVEKGGRIGCCNSAAFIDSRRGYLGSYDKAWLIPFSEFHPPSRPSFGGPSPDRYLHGAQYPLFTAEAGPERQPYRVAITICYDICFPESCWPYMGAPSGEAPECFVVPAFEAHDREFRLQKLILRQAQFRAIECRRSFARNSKGGYSGIIDGNGRLVSPPLAADLDHPVLIGRMPLDCRYSFYAAWHDWVAVAAITLIAAVSILPRRPFRGPLTRRRPAEAESASPGQ